MSPPLFSIIVPTYNRLPLIRRAVHSALSQNGCSLEVLVVDDGSTDGTLDELKRAFDDDRLRLVRQEKQGATAARNRGAEEAVGKYLVFLDSDDELLPGGLQAFARELSCGEIAVVCSSAVMVGCDGEAVRTKSPQKMGPSYEHQTGLFLAGTFAVRRWLFEQIGGFAEKCRATQHKEFALRLVPHCLRIGSRIASTDDLTVRVYSHEQSHLRSNLSCILEGRLYTIRTHTSRLRKSPTYYAFWCETAAMYAMQLGRFQEARQLLWTALTNRPKKVSIYARLLLACFPPAARLRWRCIQRLLQLSD